MRPEDKKHIPENIGRNYDLPAVIGLFLLGLVAYSNTFFNSFHFDDSSFLNGRFYLRNTDDLRYIWNFWPTRFISYLSIALNYQLGGLKVFGYHLLNFLIHICSTLLAWRLAILTFSTPSMKNEKMAAYARPIAFFIGAIFLLHPIQTQPVNYISQRATLLAAFFYIAALVLYIKARMGRERNLRGHTRLLYYAASILAALMSVFSKEMAISLPLALCLYKFYFLRTDKKFNWKYITPFLVVVLAVPLIMALTGSVDFKEMKRAGESLPGISVGQYALTQLKVMVTYIRVLFIPTNQALDYYYSPAKSIFEIPVILSLLFLLLVLTSAVGLFRKQRLASFGILFFFVTLLPESSFIPIKDVIVEHRLYLPMAGYAIFVVNSLCYLSAERLTRPVAMVLCALIICYSIATYQRNTVWENDITLWGDSIRKFPLKPRPYLNRGLAYQFSGDLEQAIADYTRAIEADRNLAEAYINRGNIYAYTGRPDLALSDYDKAIEIDPRSAVAYTNRGLARHSKGRIEEALSDYNRAIEISPNSADVYSNRGNIYLSKGDFDRAISDYDEAIKIKPRIVNAYNNRGLAYQNKGIVDKAVSDYNRAIEIDPKSADAYINRGNLYQRNGDLDLAVSDYNKAIGIDPKNANIYYNRGLAYRAKGELEQAVSDYNKAVAIDPNLVNPEFVKKLSNEITYER
jgi:tetratricopeptide (TPR) repeat protein